MLKTILVTGGAGYIGSHTIIELQQAGYHVIAVDNYANSSELTYHRIKTITNKNVTQYPIDLCNLDKTASIFENHPNIEGVIHFAALKSVPESVKSPLIYYQNNINSLLNILTCLERFNVPNFIFSSSCSVYGNVSTLPVNESTPVAEVESPYAFTKLAGERIIKDFMGNYPTKKAISLRYFNPVGAHISGKIGEVPTERPNNLVPIITKVAIGKSNTLQVFGDDYPTRDGTCVRDYIHVSDIADAHVKAISLLINTSNYPNYDVFNLGSGNGVTVLEAIKNFEKIAQIKLPYVISKRRPGDVAAIYSDSKKALEILKWAPKYGIAEMMDSAWKWEKYQLL